MYELELIIVISAVLAGWYFVGSHQNRRLSSKVWRSVLEQMDEFASEITTRELGGSAFIAVARDIRQPFKRIEIAYTSLPREILINYVISRAMGRKDLLSIMADFASTPKAEKTLKDFPDLKNDALSLRISTGRPNLRVIMSAEQVLDGSLRRVLSAVRAACSSGLC